ncbi:F-box protein SKIP28-like isoform X1 [Musa acuminata AAA Group]|uniref:F-box protein SKIP28 isoform X1 n=2 Tax=Musa acuminata AAA Group TaxID=214697 RepID=UPI0031CF058D
MEPSPLLAEDAVVGRPPPPSHDGCRNPDAGSSDGTGALLLVLGYLRLPELLAFQRVSRFFRDAVAGDGLLWRRVAVQSPLSGRLTDDALLRITSRAEGKLESLALMDCWKITDDGLMQVVDRNPGIAKLHVPGCTYLTANGIVRIVQRLYERKGNLKSLQIHGICNITKDHLDILKLLLLGSNHQQVLPPTNDRYWHSFTFINHDDRPIDVDICPKCKHVRMVFDCTRENCRSMKSQWTECRGCFFCIARCEDCGGCLDFDELGEETVCSHLLCVKCWLDLPKCNICNRPYCKGHSNFLEGSSKFLGFVCEQCMESTSSSYHSTCGLTLYEAGLRDFHHQTSSLEVFRIVKQAPHPFLV